MDWLLKRLLVIRSILFVSDVTGVHCSTIFFCFFFDQYSQCSQCSRCSQVWWVSADGWNNSKEGREAGRKRHGDTTYVGLYCTTDRPGGHQSSVVRHYGGTYLPSSFGGDSVPGKLSWEWRIDLRGIGVRAFYFYFVVAVDVGCKSNDVIEPTLMLPYLQHRFKAASS